MNGLTRFSLALDLVEEVGDGWNRWIACFPPPLLILQHFWRCSAVWISCDDEKYEHDDEREYEDEYENEYEDKHEYEDEDGVSASSLLILPGFCRHALVMKRMVMMRVMVMGVMITDH